MITGFYFWHFESDQLSVLQRGRDSNPRYSYPHTNFPGLLLRPLGHLSLFETAKIEYFIESANFNKRLVRNFSTKAFGKVLGKASLVCRIANEVHCFGNGAFCRHIFSADGSYS